MIKADAALSQFDDQIQSHFLGRAVTLTSSSWPDYYGYIMEARDGVYVIGIPFEDGYDTVEVDEQDFVFRPRRLGEIAASPVRRMFVDYGLEVLFEQLLSWEKHV